jgi:hypothetical protein
MSIYHAYEFRDPTKLYVPGHGLEQAWTCARAYVEALLDLHPPDSERVELAHHVDVVECMVTELHELDPDGTLFRYPERVAKASANKPRKRTDQPLPLDVINFANWAASADATLEAAQALLHVLHERAAALAQGRGDPSIHLHDTVMKMVVVTAQAEIERARL